MTLLNYKSYGDPINPSLMVIHGLFGSLDNWMSLCKLWSETHFVLAIDVRNHGKSFHSDDMTFESINQDILHVLNRESINKTAILGHSMGGKIAMEFAGQFPQMVDKLIVVDVAPYPYEAHHRDVFQMLQSLDLDLYDSRATLLPAVQKYISDDNVVQFVLKNIRRNEETQKFEWKFNAQILEKNYLYLIQRIVQKGYDGSVLFIGGAKSNYITPQTSGLIFQLYPLAEIEFVPEAGHWVHADNPSVFFQLTTKFLNKK